jgi:hypothetical protein
LKSYRNISISEFAENVLGIKLTAYQGYLLEKSYEVYKKDHKNLNFNASLTVKRGNTRNALFGLMVDTIIIDEFYKFENEEVKENE